MRKYIAKGSYIRSYLVFSLVITAIFVIFFTSCGHNENVPPETSPAPAASPSVSPDTGPTAVVPPVTAAPEPSLPPEPVPKGFTGFSYNGAVPESAAVEDSWFSDAVFLGDSRTEGFRLHCGLTDSHIYGGKSLSVFNVFEEDSVVLDGGATGTLLDALALRQYGKIYIMLGINELGYSADAYREKYEALTDAVTQLQPDADIYIEALIPVTASKSASSPIYNNANIQAFNEKLADLCEQKGFYYVDTYTAFAGEDGALPDADSWDGVHLTADGCAVWLDYLRTHTED